MHELHITENILQTALSQAKLQAGERIERLQILLAPDSDCTEESIRFYFEALAQNTAAATAELVFTVAEDVGNIRLAAIQIDDTPLIDLPTPTLTEHRGEAGESSKR